MTAEILCVGSELLLGNITNGNARWIAEQLASLGVPHQRQMVVGDNRERLMAEVRQAASRCRVLITTGGLGPTPDDLTTEAIAAAFETPLVEHPEVWAEIQARVSARGRICSPSSRRQAFLPQGAALLPNPTGTAPGMIWSPVPGFTVLTFPGVPSEMKAMWQQSAAPWLRQSGLAAGVFESRMLRFWGVSESALAEEMADLLEQANPTVALMRALGRSSCGSRPEPSSPPKPKPCWSRWSARSAIERARAVLASMSRAWLWWCLISCGNAGRASPLRRAAPVVD